MLPEVYRTTKTKLYREDHGVIIAESLDISEKLAGKYMENQLIGRLETLRIMEMLQLLKKKYHILKPYSPRRSKLRSFNN